MPLVSIVTAVKNGMPLLQETIASIYAQTWQDWDYWLVNDGSSDTTAEYLENLAKADPRFHILHLSESIGPYRAAMEAIRKAQGKYIVRIDADDLALPTRIEKQVQFLEANPHLKVASSYAYTFREGVVDTSYWGFYAPPLTSGSIKWHLCLRNRLVHSTACFDREAFWAMGGYRPLPLTQDYRFWGDCARLGIVGVVPEVLLHFRQHAKRVSTERGKEQSRYGQEAHRDHMSALTGQEWSEEDSRELWLVGRMQPFPIGKGLAWLDRWTALWQADKTLTPSEQAELRQMEVEQRRNFLKANLRHAPLEVLQYSYRYFI